MLYSRYTGQELGSNARIAVIANDAIGNFAIATVILAKVREKYPQSTRFLINGSRTAEFARGMEDLAEFVSVWGNDPSTIDPGIRVDHTINLEMTAGAKVLAGILASEGGMVTGPCIAPDLRGDFAFQSDARGDLWRDKEWISPEITSKFSFLNSGYIGEIFCRLAYLEGEVPSYHIPQSPPPFPTPPVVFSTSASLTDKLWVSDHWIRLAQKLNHLGFQVGLVGAAPSLNKHFWHGAEDDERLILEGGVEDLRGKLTLPRVVGALGAAKLVVSIDNGIMHLALSTGRAVVGLFRNGIHRLWAPPIPSLRMAIPEPGQDVSTIPYGEIEDLCLGVLE
ncbi:MAG: hypothetical protein JST40_07920 [Armatimonadetes bacterium]|nr:hypothetical protein [Armatimonadota bacterium]